MFFDKLIASQVKAADIFDAGGDEKQEFFFGMA